MEGAALLLAAVIAISSLTAAAGAAAATCSAAGTCAAAFSSMQDGGLHDRRFAPGLARWYIPDNLPSIWTEDHESPPLSFAEAYGHYVEGPNGIQFYDSHW